MKNSPSACSARSPLECLRRGEIRKGLNDYDAIFTELKTKSFNGWISIEDGVDGMEQLARSVDFF